jgi:DNA polymerase-1|tara:strand:- start:402 stop:1139 length:738 start_codon:yes stop_codon:yes gene_type:complete
MKQLLIDGDILIYRVATKFETEINWGDGLWTLHTDERKCKAGLRRELANLMLFLDAQDYVVAFSDKINFRKEILPSYKSNRKDKRKPMLFGLLKQYIIDEHYGIAFDSLEADDVLGILATDTTSPEIEKIIVSIDKDLQQIPGQLYDGRDIRTVTKEQGDYWFLMQTLTGDVVDGYSGCPGIGIKTAEKLLDPKVSFVENWNILVETYAKKGYSKDEVLQQARVARILRYDEYDMTQGEPLLWTM